MCLFVTKKRYDNLHRAALTVGDAVMARNREIKKMKQLNAYLIEAVERVVHWEMFQISRIVEGDECNYIVGIQISDDTNNKTALEIRITLVSSSSIKYSDAALAASYKNGYLWINDVTTKNINIGYGSLLIEELMLFCKRKKIAEIGGKLSQVDLYDKDDSHHGERLQHFYRKHGFEIVDIEGSKEKRICLELK